MLVSLKRLLMFNWWQLREKFFLHLPFSLNSNALNPRATYKWKSPHQNKNICNFNLFCSSPSSFDSTAPTTSTVIIIQLVWFIVIDIILHTVDRYRVVSCFKYFHCWYDGPLCKEKKFPCMRMQMFEFLYTTNFNCSNYYRSHTHSSCKFPP